MPAWSYLYQYGVGGLVFAVLVVLLVRARAIDASQASGRRNLLMLVGIMALYAMAHALTVFVLPRT